MTKVRKRSRRVLWALGVPTAVGAAGLAYVGDHTIAAAGVGAVIGFVIGFAIIAFPNLDRGGPEDSDDMFH
jgi:ElaB/YqjD/DUF883 family membrane-anchored ribosome-binding protein